jgi:superfamily II DNA or RNA helicase
MTYAVAEPEERYRIAATAASKMPVIRRVLERHPDEQKLVIGAYLDQLEELGAALDAPVIQGSTSNRERERLFDQFRPGELRTLVVSKVANFSIDLPEAAVAVQVSGTFGSRQEEAQRLGRVLRPKAGRRTSTRWSAATPSTPSTPPTGSGSSPSRATRTRSSTPPIWPAPARSTAPAGWTRTPEWSATARFPRPWHSTHRWEFAARTSTRSVT